MYLCDIDFASFYDFSIGFWNCSDGVVIVVFNLGREELAFSCNSSLGLLLNTLMEFASFYFQIFEQVYIHIESGGVHSISLTGP